jgi:hypothetical protein
VDVIVDVVVVVDGDGDGENLKWFDILSAIDPAPAFSSDTSLVSDHS